MKSPNYNARQCAIDMVVIHYTQMATAREAIERLCDPQAEVSAHYVIDKKGVLMQLVDEDKRAWHAGVSWWGGQTDINSRSVGIELDNTGEAPFPDAQMCALEQLLADLIARYDIELRNVVGHSDVSMGRKVDPGARFDWRRLERQKLAFDRFDDIETLGYCPDNPVKRTRAMALRFRAETAPE